MDQETALQINQQLIKDGKTVLRAINHPLRQRILELIHKKGSMIVTDIYHELQLEQSVASQQLAILRGAKIVATKREGKRIFYSVNYERVKEIHMFSEKLIHRN